MLYQLKSELETCTGLHKPQIHLSLSNLSTTLGPSCESSWHSIPASLLLNKESGPNPGPGGQVTWDILHPPCGLSQGELVRAWRTEPGNVSPHKKCSWCPGLKLRSWSPFACQFSLGRTGLKSGWAVKRWVPCPPAQVWWAHVVADLPTLPLKLPVPLSSAESDSKLPESPAQEAGPWQPAQEAAPRGAGRQPWEVAGTSLERKRENCCCYDNAPGISYCWLIYWSN